VTISAGSAFGGIVHACFRDAAMPREGERLNDSYDPYRMAWGWRSDRWNILPWSTTSFRARSSKEQEMDKAIAVGMQGSSNEAMSISTET
jgi:hypothetical protein